MTAILKSRNWAFCVYPESAPENWREMLSDLHMKALVSPLHNKDVAADGTIKKEHYHVVLVFEGPQTHKRANEIIAPFCGTKSAECVHSLRGYCRYLAHMDSPEKAQYNPDEIIALGGIELADLLKPSSGDRIQIINDMLACCTEYSILEFSDLVEYARKEHLSDWFPVLVDCAYFVSRYLTSFRHAEQAKQAMATKSNKD